MTRKNKNESVRPESLCCGERVTALHPNGTVTISACPDCPVDKTPLDASNVGAVGVCSIGEVGVITGMRRLPWGWSYVGINTRNGGAWAGREPKIIAPNLGEYIASREAAAHSRGTRAEPMGALPVSQFLR